MQNRVYEIRHCSGRDNPADLPSRGLTPRELAASQLWKNGPDWLREIELSCAEVEIQMPEECNSEMKISKAQMLHSLLAKSTVPGIGLLMKCEDFSSFQRLTAATAIVLKFCPLLLECVRPKPSSKSTDDHT